MQIEIIQEGRVLRRISHNGTEYIEAPPEGDYQIRLTNNSPHRRLAVVTVDGVNVNDGSEGSLGGSGYAMSPWQTFTLKGWLRSGSEAAAFTFKPNGDSYASKTGRGTKNTGVIGVAVFDEKPKPVVFQPPIIIEKHHHHHDWPWSYPRVPRPAPYWQDPVMCGLRGQERGDDIVDMGSGDDFLTNLTTESGVYKGTPSSTTFSSTAAAASASLKSSAPRGGARSSVRSKSKRAQSAEVEGTASLDLGTGYGQRVTQHTTTVEFERASAAPSFVLSVRYAVRAKLREWGVPVDETVSTTVESPNPFPAAPGFAQPPAGWVG